MTLPATGYIQQVEVVVGGTLPRAGWVQPVEIVGPGPGAESLEQARAVGDSFTGGSVYWDNSLEAQFGRASGEANVDYARVYFDQTNHLFAVDSTKDGAGTIRPISFQMGGSEVARLTAVGQFLVGVATLSYGDAVSIFRKDANQVSAIYVENKTAGINAGAALVTTAHAADGSQNYIQVSCYADTFTTIPFLAGKGVIIANNSTSLTKPALAIVSDGAPLMFSVDPLLGVQAQFLTSGKFVYGGSAVFGSEVYRIIGDTRIDGKLTVTGAMDPTSLSLSDPAAGTDLFLDSANGLTAPLSAAAHGRIRYNNTSKTWQQSVDSGAYTDILTSGSAWINGGNAFGGAGTFGTTDNNSIVVKTNNTTVGTVQNTGEWVFTRGSNVSFFESRVSGDASPRFHITATGDLAWSDGTGTFQMAMAYSVSPFRTLSLQSGNLLIQKVTGAAAIWNNSGSWVNFVIQVQGQESTGGGTIIACQHANDDPTTSYEFTGYRARGTLATPTALVAGDRGGRYACVGLADNGSGTNVMRWIGAYDIDADAGWGTAGSAPGILKFRVSPQGAYASPSIVWTIPSSGCLIPGADATYDLGGIVDATGAADVKRVKNAWFTGAISLGISALTSGFDVNFSRNTILIGSDANANTRTNNTTKVGIDSSFHYANAQLPVCAYTVVSSSSANEVAIGGGSSLVNAATKISFYTGATTTTSPGTERGYITSTGTVVWNGNMTITPTGNTVIVGDVAVNASNRIAINSAAASTSELQFWSAGSNVGAIYRPANKVNIAIGITGFDPAITVATGGYVVVGVDSASVVQTGATLRVVRAGAAAFVVRDDTNSIEFEVLAYTAFTEGAGVGLGTVTNHQVSLRTNDTVRQTWENTGNIAVFAAGSYGSGTKVLFVGNASGNPSGNPTGGGILYADSGAGKWRGSGGTVTTFGPAEPHCAECGSDYGHEWVNEKWGRLQFCVNCLTDHIAKDFDGKLPRWIKREAVAA